MKNCVKVGVHSQLNLVEERFWLFDVVKPQPEQIAPLVSAAQRVDEQQIVVAARIEFGNKIAPDEPAGPCDGDAFRHVHPPMQSLLLRLRRVLRHAHLGTRCGPARSG